MTDQERVPLDAPLERRKTRRGLRQAAKGEPGGTGRKAKRVVTGPSKSAEAATPDQVERIISGERIPLCPGEPPCGGKPSPWTWAPMADVPPGVSEEDMRWLEAGTRDPEAEDGWPR
jgi:hypothetical protein